jgi:prolipoprotein diacylglyceryl transferase
MTMLASIPVPPITELHLGPLRVTMFGIVVALAVLAGITVTRRRYQAAGGDPEVAERILLSAVLLGFVGARAGYVLTHTDRFAGRWLDVLAVWHGGLVLFGGLTVGMLTAVWLARRHGADLGAFAGAAAIGIPLAQALGRPADYFSQELFGTPSTLPWAVEIPERLRPAPYLDAATFHPAFLYEALWSLATVGVLLVLERRGILNRGRLLYGYLVAYGTGRFALELIRTDTTFRLLGISRNGWIAAALVIGGTVALLATRARQIAPTPEPTTPLVGADTR